jgi:hypothetical protein
MNKPIPAIYRHLPSPATSDAIVALVCGLGLGVFFALFV